MSPAATSPRDPLLYRWWGSWRLRKRGCKTSGRLCQLPHETPFSIGGGEAAGRGGRGGSHRAFPRASPRDTLLYRWWGSQSQLPHETPLPIARESVAARHLRTTSPRDPHLYRWWGSRDGDAPTSPRVPLLYRWWGRSGEVISGRLPASPRDPLLYRWWGSRHTNFPTRPPFL